MNVLIFGGCGFLGKQLAYALLKLNHNVTIFDQRREKFKIKNIKFISGNILNKNSVTRAAQKKDVVFNFAALSDIEESIQNPVGAANINIIGNMNIALACIKNKVKKLIFASTIYVHSDQGGFYKVSKQSSELFLEEFYKRFKLRYTTLRFGTIYGKSSSVKNGLKKVVFNALKNKKLEYSGSNKAQRRYLHVSDAVKACIKIINKKYDNKNVLITGKKIIKVRKILKILSKKLNLNKKFIFKNQKGNGHYDSSPYTYKKMREEKLKFKTAISIEEGIDELIRGIKNL
jgi:UDP-glucose 4-epimerase